MSIAAAEAPVVAGPPLPMGRRVVLRGRGTTFYREVEGPPGAPTVVLIHGWMASGGINWFRVFDQLGEHYRVIAPDLRGHGRGIRTSRRFRISDCADDIAALLDTLEAGPVIVVGYSLGGPVAQMLWHRHPDKVEGLVLCATAAFLMPGAREAFIFGSMMTVLATTTRASQVARKIPLRPLRQLMPQLPASTPGRPANLRAWVTAEMRRHSGRMILEAGIAMSSFSSRRWIGGVNVPTVVVVTTKDRAVPAVSQLQLAMAIPDAAIHRVDDGHLLCAKPAFATSILAACQEVNGRIRPA